MTACTSRQPPRIEGEVNMSIVEYARNAFRRYMTEMNYHYEAGHIKDAQAAASRAQFFREIVLLNAEDAGR